MYLTEQLNPETDPYLKGYLKFKKNILLRGCFYRNGQIDYRFKDIVANLNPSNFEEHPNGGGFVQKSLNIPETQYVPRGTIVVKEKNRFNTTDVIMWISGGQFHREDGPAVITSHSQDWYIHDKPILSSPAEFLIYIKTVFNGELGQMVIYRAGSFGNQILSTLYGTDKHPGMVKKFKLQLPQPDTRGYSKFLVTVALGKEIIPIKGIQNDQTFIEGWVVGGSNNRQIKNLIQKFKTEKGLTVNVKKVTPL